MMKLLVGFLMFAALLGTGTLWWGRDTEAKLPALRTAEVTRGDLSLTIDATGTVEPEEVVDVGAQVAGRIFSLGTDPRDAERMIDYGSPVEVGTVLARIDDSMYASEVDQARAQVESAAAMLESTTAQVAEAEANVQRSDKDLLDLAQSTFEAADAAVGVGQATIAQSAALLTFSKANVIKARADLSQAQATLKRAETNLGYCTIKSPVKGVIVDRRINVGQTVVSSLNSPSLFLLAKDLKRLEVWASVNEADIGNIKSGQRVKFTVDTYPNRVFEGVVAADQPRLNASMNQSIVTYTVVVDTDNSDGVLLPYLTADVAFQVDRHESVLLVPNTALRWRPSPERLKAAGIDPATAVGSKPEGEAGGDGVGQGTLWVLENGRIRSMVVQEVMSDGTLTEVTGAGLEAGMQVVVSESYDTDDSGTTNPFTTQMFGNSRKAQ
jgi:HlyD family secretion protein